MIPNTLSQRRDPPPKYPGPWRFLEATQLRSQQLPVKIFATVDARYDILLHGYWIRIGSKLYTQLALMNLEFGRTMTEVT